MGEHSKRTCCVVDQGLFVELAVTLAKDFGRVLYACDWVSAFPKSNSTLIGKGLPGVERIESIWPYLDEIDLFVFPDVYQGPLQVHLVQIGKRVWGSRMGENIELNRVGAKEHMKSLGIDIGPYEVIKGLDDLREFLKEHDDQYVKVSKTRGDFETFHAKNYHLAEPMLDEIEHRLGAKKKVIEFVVEEGLNGAVEVGYDGYTIDGQFPSKATWGLEIKDKGFVMRTQDYDQMPESVRGVNEKLSDTFKAFQYRGFISSELRVTKDGKAYAIDPCARMGSPPGELFQIMFTNLADILWNGADGKMVEPEFAAPWGAELLLHSQWADQNWQAIEFPKKYADNVKLRNRTIIDGTNYVVPQAVGLPEVGAVVALGQTMEEAMQKCIDISDEVEGYCVHVDKNSLKEAEDEIEELKGFGIDFKGDKPKANGKAIDKPPEGPQKGSLAEVLSHSPRMKGLSEALSEALK